MKFTNYFSKNKIAQTQVIKGEEHKMIKNDAGGYVYKISPKKSLMRFLIIGSEGGTYYANEGEITVKNAENIVKIIETGKAKLVVDSAIEVSVNALARKNDPAIFALALVLSFGNVEDKRYVLESDAVNKVCRIGTHLFALASYIKDLRGWGSIVKKVFSKWYLEKTVDKLSYQMIKYQKRNSWSHRDLLRLNHIKADNQARDMLFFYTTQNSCIKGESSIEDFKELRIIEGFEKAKKAETEKEVISLISKYSLTREMINTRFLNKVKVQEALLPNLGLTAIVRNLGSFTASNFLNDFNFEAVNYICDKLKNKEIIKKSKIHPLQILDALYTYKNGHGFRGNLTWKPVNKILSALDKAFYLSFGNLESTGKNVYLAIDMSGSMSWEAVRNSVLTPAQISAALALITANVEKNYIIKGFSSKMIDININPNMSLNEVMKEIESKSWGSTDCALPMLDALDNQASNIDAFVIYTDNDTWYGKVHPSQALKQYRKYSKRFSKLISVGMTATNFSIADESDAGMLDIAGFSTDTPKSISSFITDKF